MFCQYSDIFGKPNTGIHSYRFMGMASVDLLLTLLGAILFAYLFNMSILIMFFILMIIGLIFHLLFCVKTTIVKLLFYFYY